MKDEQYLEQILNGDPEPSFGIDPLAQYAEVTPRRVAAFNLIECSEQLARVADDSFWLVHAAKSAHLALQAALTDALAGSSNIGAFEPKLKAEYLRYFEELRDGDATHPSSDKVMHFNDLLAAATTEPLEWSGKLLEVSPADTEALKNLTFVRHRIEHVRPGSHFFQPAFICATLPIAARITLELLDICGHQYEEGQKDKLTKTVEIILRLSTDISTRIIGQG